MRHGIKSIPSPQAAAMTFAFSSVFIFLLYTDILIYCREGYRLENLSRAQLERKLDLCRNYCDIFTILEPGAGETVPFLISPDCSCNAFKVFCWCPPVVTVCSMAKPTRQCQRFPQLCGHSVIVVNKKADTVSTYLCRYRIWRGCVPEEMLGPLSSIFRV